MAEPDEPTPEQIAAATTIIRSLTGYRWVWPPIEARELYPSPTRGRVVLRSAPVREVVSVKNYDTGDDLEYVKTTAGVLLLKKKCGIKTVDVVYQYGSPPPPTIQNAINALAREFVLSEADSSECRLPTRVTSVQRQGMSWTIIDPQQFLDQGRTGVYDIDIALRAAGPKGRLRTRVSSAEFQLPDRLSTTVLPLPEP